MKNATVQNMQGKPLQYWRGAFVLKWWSENNTTNDHFIISLVPFGYLFQEILEPTSYFVKPLLFESIRKTSIYTYM